MGVTEARVRAVLGARDGGPVGSWPGAAPGPASLNAGFVKWFGTEPAGLWHAPGRLALMGEQTAAIGGPALFAALPWGVTAAVGPTEDGRTRTATPHGPLSERHRAAREVESVAASARACGLLSDGQGLRVVFGADLPAHSSLGYAAALGAAVTLALADLAGADLPEDLPVARRVCLTARSGQVVRVNQGSGRAALFPFDLTAADLRLVVMDTGALPRRDPRPTRAAELTRAEELLGPLRSIQDLPATLRGIQHPVLRERVEFAATEIHRLNATVGLLRTDRCGEVGPVLSASHLSLRGFDLPLRTVEAAVEAAARSGARGARMTGWAGTAFALVPSDRVEDVAAGVREAFRGRGRPEPRVRVAVPAEGARRVD
ncbi:galactokinase family protein [Nocardiopsis sp. MG754419]|uniref:galactokinase family protein n=1 Tax=Nocardiopsis sp. MG754419 TaxID=2259865 RepID=UPI001BA67C4C|nr:galactokinase family protein [Nocardiopsis sp. MG754419]MBR8741272.1 GHMP kinase [Nocardiopsis sp. MG754419]